MKNSNVVDRGHEVLSSYIKRIPYGRQFSANTMRNKLRTIKGLSPYQISGIISSASRGGMIVRVGETQSTEANHNGGTVGVYRRLN
jgi:hypothetical protein